MSGHTSEQSAPRPRPPIWLAVLCLALALPMSWACDADLDGRDPFGSRDTSVAPDDDATAGSDTRDGDDASDAPTGDVMDPDTEGPDIADTVVIPGGECRGAEDHDTCRELYGEDFVCNVNTLSCTPRYQSGGLCAAAAYDNGDRAESWHVTGAQSLTSGRVESRDGRLVHIGGPVIPVQVFGDSQ